MAGVVEDLDTGPQVIDDGHEHVAVELGDGRVVPLVAGPAGGEGV